MQLMSRYPKMEGLDRLLRAFACTPAGVLAIVGTDDEKFSPNL